MTSVVTGVLPQALAGASGPPVPTTTFVKSAKCVDELPPPKTVADGISAAQGELRYPSAWRFSTGAGVKIAVIDTGVNPGPAFGARLHGLADLVARDSAEPGLDDCDGHGTLVAGIAAGTPDAKTGFAGVAPDASVLSIRQSSENFQPADHGSARDEQGGAGSRESLAQAIDFATQQGAQVINISEADCQHAGSADLPELSTAVRSAVARNVVVVVAAGNLSSSGACSTQNTPGKAPVTQATPADINIPGVLAVAATDRDGGPASFSLAGPWVDLAAPGTQIISTDPFPDASGQVNRITTGEGTGSIQGTSFAAPYVAGTAALVRARYPQLTAPQVADLLERTAAHPAAPGERNDFVGFGVVDPLAALTALPPVGGLHRHDASSLAPSHGHWASPRPRETALWGTLAAALAVLVLAIVGRTRRIRRRRSRTGPLPAGGGSLASALGPDTGYANLTVRR